MSRINRIRIINLNYNHNTYKIDDETFDLGGKSTLLSMRNGGGKSVLVQVITAIFVNKRYRNFNERPFDGYFTGSQHTVIMCEWLLDNGNGYFLNGFLVRKNQDTDRNDEKLDITALTGSYRNACEYDLDNIDVISTDGGRRSLKSFAECKAVFDRLKKSKHGDFNTYDMSSSNYSRQYFDRLRQFGINNKEWESIVWNINQKESGLSELFSNAKDESGLIENWIIRVIRDKLNQEKDREKEFQNLTFKFVENYRLNQSKIEKKGLIEKYFEDTAELKELIEAYAGEEDAAEETLGNILMFLQKCDGFAGELDLQREEADGKLAGYEDELKRIEYEEISNKVYGYEDEQSRVNREKLDVEVTNTAIKQELDKNERGLCRQECKRIFTKIVEFREEKAEKEKRIEALTASKADNKEKVEETGRSLYALYTSRVKRSEETLSGINLAIGKLKDELEYQKSSKNEINSKKLKMTERRGEVSGKIHQYDFDENDYNAKYGNVLLRNLFKKYEDGTLTRIAAEYEEELLAKKNESASYSLKIQKLEEESKRLMAESNQIDLSQQACRVAAEKLESRQKEFLMQRERRLNICRLLEIVEENVDNKPYIAASLGTVIREREEKKNEQIVELSNRQKDLGNLRSGRLTELPENIKSYMENSGIDFIYGYDWLSRNSYPAERNKKLVAENPFIPYSIIVDRTTFETMCTIDEALYTSFPVPVIIRDELEKAGGNTSGRITSYENVHFFVLFNDMLLDEEGLKKSIAEIESDIEKTETRIASIDSELDTYRGYAADLDSQEYTEAGLKKLEKDIAANNEKSVELDRRKHENHNRTQEAEQEKKSCDKSVANLREDIHGMEKRSEQFEVLCRKYEEYQKNLIEIEEIEMQLRDADARMSDTESRIEAIGRELDVEEGRRRNYEQIVRDSSKKAEKYKMHHKDGDKEAEYDDELAMELEAEYNALTREISISLEEAGKELDRTNSRLAREEEDLKKKNKFGLEQEEYEDIEYDDALVEKYEANRSRLEKQKNSLENKLERLSERKGNLEESRNNALKELKQQTGYDEPIGRDRITSVNFGERKQTAHANVRRLENAIDAIEKDEATVQRAKDLLVEYENAECVWDETKKTETLDSMDVFVRERVEEICTFAKKLKNDYKGHQDRLGRQRDKIIRVIGALAMMECYREEYFKKTFAQLNNQIENANGLKRQYEIIVETYHKQLEKLEIDLKSTFNERKETEQLFLEYVRDINENLGSVDKNATIPVRGRNIKMLNIKVPEWEKEKEHFANKLHDYFESVVQMGLDTIEKGGNLLEQLGKLIVARKLYDEVVGVGNVEIKLYKIEEGREVSIPWSEVAANSGGEGFLSAFVVLVCLMSYMRRDSSDIFATGEEGKVLIMDNPFAKTSSEHLLKPLVEMADKTNTQLICLSDIGKEAIYNRFDNIYELKLVDSSIQTGKQYMRVEHKKGDDVKKMVLSEFKIEQLGLFD